jgi:hypothetical protein
MSTETAIYFSVTGKSEHKELYAYCSPQPKEVLRQWAIELWYDMRTRQKEAGYKPSAAVWVGQTRCQPTAEEIAAHEEKIADLLRNQPTHNDSVVDDEEPQDVVEGEWSSSSGPLAEDSPKDEPDDEPEAPSLVWDDDDDLDF